MDQPIEPHPNIVLVRFKKVYAGCPSYICSVSNEYITEVLRVKGKRDNLLLSINFHSEDEMEKVFSIHLSTIGKMAYDTAERKKAGNGISCIGVMMLKRIKSNNRTPNMDRHRCKRMHIVPVEERSLFTLDKFMHPIIGYFGDDEMRRLKKLMREYIYSGNAFNFKCHLFIKVRVVSNVLYAMVPIGVHETSIIRILTYLSKRLRVHPELCADELLEEAESSGINNDVEDIMA
jgi:hypothetical protein